MMYFVVTLLCCLSHHLANTALWSWTPKLARASLLLADCARKANESRLNLPLSLHPPGSLLVPTALNTAELVTSVNKD